MLILEFSIPRTNKEAHLVNSEAIRPLIPK